MGTAHYIHGAAAIEQRRLSHLNRLLNDAALRELNLQGGERVLDLGCGLAQLTRAMARVAGPAGRVVGIEANPAQLAEAQRQALDDGEESLVDLRLGDARALTLPPDEASTFDVVHARFLLEHVPDPLTVVRAMAGAARPGGRLVLADDDHDVLRLHPEPPGLREIWQAYVRSYDRLGNDPFVGRRLVELLHQAHARPVRNTWLFFGACSGEEAFLPLVENLAVILEGARSTLLALALASDDSFDAALAALRVWAGRPDAALWYAVCWAEGRMPEAP